nr:group I intron-associated PD-(D/E)XK endonuclease [Trichocoleus sp. FACHB-90]
MFSPGSYTGETLSGKIQVDNKTWLGSLGESKVAAELSRHRFHVFTQTTGKAPFDLVAYKDGYLYRINVKTTQRLDKWGSWEVQIKSLRSNRTKNRIIPFDPQSCDVLAVYIEPLDKVCFLQVSEVSGKNSIALREKAAHQSKLACISELTNPERICYLENKGINETLIGVNKLTEKSSNLRQATLAEVPYKRRRTGKDSGTVLAKKERVHFKSRKVERPSKEELEKMIWETSVLEVSRKYGVSDVAVAKWCKKYGISRPPRGHWAKKNQSTHSKL